MIIGLELLGPYTWVGVGHDWRMRIVVFLSCEFVSDFHRINAVYPVNSETNSKRVHPTLPPIHGRARLCRGATARS
jgi:hypothetical protein